MVFRFLIGVGVGGEAPVAQAVLSEIIPANVRAKYIAFMEGPDVVIAPIVGYDRDGYRLGYDGGYFDRTLAAIRKRPLIIGVGYGQAAIPTIFPGIHDIPMDKIVTEQGIFLPARSRGQCS